MGDSAMTVVAIFLAAILMFVFPLMTMADKKDDVTTLSVQTATSEFTNKMNLAIESGTFETQNGTSKVIDTKGWAKWIIGNDGYPTLDTKTCWNGIEWESVK